jgi:hypothetical protein
VLLTTYKVDGNKISKQMKGRGRFELVREASQIR